MFQNRLVLALATDLFTLVGASSHFLDSILSKQFNVSTITFSSHRSI